jgi:coenzyme F420 hydrogenase subunit delta
MEWSAIHSSRVLVLGCGNILKGDDGVGPAVALRMEDDPRRPGDVHALDLGTSIKHLLFDIVTMKPEGLQRIVIVDAVAQENRLPGEFWEIDVDQMKEEKIKDYSIHMFPSVNLLKKIKEEAGIDLRIIAVQTEYIPEGLDERLTPVVEAAVPAIVDRVLEICADEGK